MISSLLLLYNIYSLVKRGDGMDQRWNPWHGCHKLSEGCRNCYVYRMDARHEKNAGEVKINVSSFRLPVAKNRQGGYKYPSGTVFYTCFTSDFFLEDADRWRGEIWQIIRERSDCKFFIITKRIDRFLTNIPEDWGEGYDNVAIAVTTENQKMADYRLPIYLNLPIKHKLIVCEPLLEEIHLSKYLLPQIESVSVGGESGPEARPCHYEWVLNIREQCIKAGVPFDFRQTGAKFIKDGKLYRVPKEKQIPQAQKAAINYK